MTAQISAQIDVVKADAQKRLTDALTKRDAVVAEERATVAAALAQAIAEVEVQKARVEQVRRQLEADVIAPAKAACQEAEAGAKADAAPIVQDGKARAEVLAKLAASWEKAGPSAREIFVLQKLDKVIGAITDVIGDTPIEKVAFIAGGEGKDNLPLKAAGTLEGIQQVLGIDLKEKIANWGNAKTVAVEPVPPPEEPEEDQY